MQDDKKGTFLELYPELADQWHPSKNEHLTIESFSYGSSKKVWWICAKSPDHEWQSSIHKRTMAVEVVPFALTRKCL